MYKVLGSTNSLEKIEEPTFSELNYLERENLQEWIATTPNIFGEELLIIQKEFDGFSETRERLDLLALDKEGNLVIIENKLDDSGRDVVWQALKYASYCSTLKKNQVVEIYQDYLDKYENSEKATDKLTSFFEVDELDEIELNTIQTQRIIFVAANFRKEVTSTALWLMSYGIRLQCFKAVMYQQGDQHLLDLSQIIPVREAEDYIIKMSSKQQEETEVKSAKMQRHKVRKEFWAKVLDKLNEMTDLYKNISPSKYPWLATGSGVAGVVYSMVVTRSYCRVELYPGRKSKEENLKNYNAIMKYKEEIEDVFGDKLNWDKLSGKNATRISYIKEGVSIYNEEDHEEIIDFLTENIVKLYKAMDPVIKKID